MAVVNRVGDEHRAGIGQSFHPRRDVDAVTIEVVALTITSPRLMPMRSSMRCPAPNIRVPAGHRLLHRDRQRTASTTLANSTNMPSPVVLTMPPRCSGLAAHRQAVQEFLTTREGFRLATRNGGVLTGCGANIILIDDPLKAGGDA